MSEDKAKNAPKGKRLASTVYLTDPETNDAVAYGPGAVDQATGREIYAFTINGEPADELPAGVEAQIKNPSAWAK